MKDTKAILVDGINAIKAGDNEEGQRLLKEVLAQDSKNITAWLWYAKSQTSPEKRLQYINRALSIDPNHPAAQKMLDLHIEKYGKQPAATASRITSTSEFSAPKIEDDSPTDLGRHIKHSGTNIVEQVLRLILIAVTGGLVTYTFVINRENGSYLMEYIQTALNHEAWVWQQSRWMFPVILLSAYGFSLYQLFFFVVAFFESLDIHQRGIVHHSFGKSKAYYWQDFTSVKIMNQRYVYRVVIFPLIISRFSLDLKSEKGNFSITKQYQGFRQIGQFVLDAIRPYAEIKNNVWW
jgi:hypothetical protein